MQIEVKRGVYYVMAKGARFCLHVGMTAIFFGRFPDPNTQSGPRLEILTPYQRFRWAKGHRSR